ncbi:MAG TPA: hypothetical protein PLZ36_06775 [Armatimonadota bacterium]|nr:hypothetical protein [Armatimonadota bacterium]HOS42930.1 hypothetical protein [Armatimonadota bacterium]
MDQNTGHVTPAPIVPPTPPAARGEAGRPPQPPELPFVAGMLVVMALYYLFEAAWFWRLRILVGLRPAPLSPLVLIAWGSIVLRLLFVPWSVYVVAGILRAAPWARRALLVTLVSAVGVTVGTYLLAGAAGGLTGPALATLAEIARTSSVFYLFITLVLFRDEASHYLRSRGRR